MKDIDQLCRDYKIKNPKHKLLIKFYTAFAQPTYLNGKQSAIAAGYVPGSADVQASKILVQGGPARQVVDIIIGRTVEQVQKNADISKQKLINNLAEIHETDILDFLEYRTVDGEERLFVKDLREVERCKIKAIKRIRHTKWGPEVELYDHISISREMGKMSGYYEPEVKIDNNLNLEINFGGVSRPKRGDNKDE